MVGEWLDQTLGDVLTLQRGFDLPETERQVGSVPVIASTGQVGTHNEAAVTGPGVVIGRSGSLGGGQFIRTDFWPLNTTLWVKDFKGNDVRFCYYLLKSLDLANFNAGSGVPTLNRNHIHPIPVRVPVNVLEQRAIARVIGTLDDKIELSRRMNETLEAMARAIFKSWFVDGDANGESGKVGDIVMLSRETINPREFPQETFDHYSIPAFDEEHLPKAETGEQIQSNKFIVPMGSVLLSKLNPRIPRVWLPNVSQTGRSVCSTEFIVAIPKPSISREYVYGLFKSPSFLDLFATLITGTSGSHQRVKPEYLLAMDVDVPAKERMAKYTALVKPLHDRVTLNLEESRRPPRHAAAQAHLWRAAGEGCEWN